MRLNDKSFERLAALSIGTIAVAFGNPAGAVPASIGAAGLIRDVMVRNQQFGPENPRILAKLREKVRDGYSEFLERDADGWGANAELVAADRALQEALNSSQFDRESLAKAAVSSAGFVETATEIVMVALAERRPDAFGAGQSGTIAHRYARDVIRAGLSAAFENENYYRKLEPRFVLEIAGVLGEVREDVHIANAKLDRQESMLAEVLATLQQPAPSALLSQLAADFGHDNPAASDEEFRTFLREKAADYARLQAQISSLAAADQRVGNLLAAAQAALDAGNFDEADARLADAEEMQQAEHTLKEIRKQSETRRVRGESMLMKGAVEAAAGHYAKAAGFFDQFDEIEGASLRDEFANTLSEHSRRYGGSGMQHAIRFYRLNLETWSEADHPLQWAATQNNLGAALRNQGARLAGAVGAALLGEAVAAYRAALRVYTEADHPLNWAMTQNNHGNALRNQGERLAGAAGAALAGEAVAAYRAALRVYTEADHPLQWAATQNNLGNALGDQGARLAGAVGAALLGEAVAAYRAALRVYTEADHPLNWAMTQNNLGAALGNQGARLDGAVDAALRREAVEAYRAALRVYTEADHPLGWAGTQNNLGNALRNQGERLAGAAGAALAGEAVAAYRAALRVYTEADHPLNWAMTQNNLGAALRNQGARLAGAVGAALLGEAVAAYRAALRVYTEADHPLGWAGTQNNLGNALRNQGERLAGAVGAALLGEAVAAYRAALRVYTEANHPLQWKVVTDNLQSALDKIKRREGRS